MEISNRLIDLSNRSLKVDFDLEHNRDFIIKSFNIDIDQKTVIKVMGRESGIDLLLLSDQQEEKIILNGLIGGLLELIRGRTLNKYDQWPEFREVENMARDKNSTPSFMKELLPVIEEKYKSAKNVVVRVFRLVDLLFKNEHRVMEFDQLTFFEQVLCLDQLRADFSNGFIINIDSLPRLDTWMPQNGQLSFSVDPTKHLSKVDSVLFYQLYTNINTVRAIKMVAGE